MKLIRPIYVDGSRLFQIKLTACSHSERVGTAEDFQWHGINDFATFIKLILIIVLYLEVGVV